MAEEHFIPSNSKITCTGCPKESSLIAINPTIYLKKQPIVTEKDALPSSIVPFASCSLNLNKVCTLVPQGGWINPRDTISATKQKPLIEQSTLKCTAQLGIGIIKIVKKTDTPPPPENVVDKAQDKVNKAANYASKKVTEVAQAAKDTVGDIAGVAKEATSFIQNESFQGVVSNASNLVDGIDQKKAELDVAVGNVNVRLENLRKELTQLITGEKQDLQDLMTVKDNSLPEGDTVTPLEESPVLVAVPLDSEEESKEEELKYNQDFFDQANKESANEFLDGINEDINALETSSEGGTTPRSFEVIEDKDSSTRHLTAENQKPSEIDDSIPLPENRFGQIQDNWETEKDNAIKGVEGNYSTANDILKEHGESLGSSDDKKEQLKALAALENLPNLLDNEKRTQFKNRMLDTPETSILDTPGIISEKPRQYSTEELNAVIGEETGELNTKVQAEIDEVLKEIGYLEGMQKYQKESSELQEDIDKSAAALDVLGDFNAFIDGIAAKHLGKLANKYKNVMGQLGKNMSRLNDSLKGASFMAGGFTAGDVITHAPDVKEEEKKEENETNTTVLVNPPPTKPENPPEEANDDKKEDECSLTEIKIIKNDTYEYTLSKNNYASETAFSGSLPDPIIFIAGTTKNKKKLTLKFEGLDCSSCTQGHEKPKEYYRDGMASTLQLNNNKADVLIFHNPNQVEGLFGDFIDLMVLGYRAMKPIEYNIPIELCDFSKAIQAKAYIDAEWHLLISLSSKDPLTLEHTGHEESVFNKYADIASRLDRRNASLKPNQKDLKYENKGADLVIAVGAFYDNKAQSHNLSKKFNFKKIQDSSQKLFSTLDILTKFTKKVTEIGDGGKGKKQKPLKKYLGVSAKFDPPTLEVKASGSLEEKTNDPFFGIGYSGEIEIQSKLLSFELEIDLIKAAKKHPLLLFIDGLITAAEEAYKKALYYLNMEDKFIPFPRVEDFVKANIVAKAHFFIKGSRKILGENQNTVIEGGGAGSVKVLLEGNLNTTSMGFKYVFKSTNALTTGISASTALHFEDSIYLSLNSKFDGMQLTGSITYQIQGWKLTGVVAEAVDSIKDFFGFGNDESLIDGDKDTKGDYLIDVDLSTKYADIEIFEGVSNSTKIYLTDKKSSGYITGGGF
ncbi:PAAR-like protein [Aquimarina sp. 2201CG14-23]|uniref:PAAR-like protein n=1 Tax=Aquimarina mycalae TaxID=3040073 RepID=UPI002477F510|nr:PAAR-like protein [Aquimarina sp. 2201CG14-23]MDH7448220.1 PAAR-like protein [Aquimarina sp. 2201CG14-23]